METPYYPNNIFTAKNKSTTTKKDTNEKPIFTQSQLFNLLIPMLSKNKNMSDILSILNGKPTIENLTKVMSSIKKEEVENNLPPQNFIDEY